MMTRMRLWQWWWWWGEVVVGVGLGCLLGAGVSRALDLVTLHLACRRHPELPACTAAP